MNSENNDSSNQTNLPNDNQPPIQEPELENIGESSSQIQNQPNSDDLLGSISNNIFLSENTLETLFTILFSQGSYLDDISLNDGFIEEKFSKILRGRHDSLLNFLGDKMQFYHSKMIDGELSHLEKLMKILRSKNREMRLKRIDAEDPANVNTEENIMSQQNQSDHQAIEEQIGKIKVRSKSFSSKNLDAELTQIKKVSSCLNLSDPIIKEVNPIEKQNKSLFGNGYNLLNFNDLCELSSLNIFKKKVMREYNPSDNSFSFKLNNRYLVTLKSFDEKPIDKKSFFHKIPYSVMLNYIFPCFSAYGLFYLRQVSSEWRELIRSMWHKTFQREMHEQLYAADLCQEIECNFRLIALRTPFVHKFAIFLKALTEILDWKWVMSLPTLKNEDVDKRIKMTFYSIFRILGNRILPDINNLNDLSDEIWEEMKPALLDNTLKRDMDNVIDSEFFFPSNSDIIKLREKLVNSYLISMGNLSDIADKNNVVVLNIFLKQLFLFALLKNSVFIGQKFLYFVKDVLKKISDSWPQKKGFLEGAYKILLFKNIKFVNGEIIVAQEEECDAINNNLEENKDEDDSDAKSEFMNLLNNFRDPTKPDFVIKKKGAETRIFLDDGTKAELILSSILSFSTNSLGNLINLASKTKEKIESINEEIKNEEALEKIKNEDKVEEAEEGLKETEKEEIQE